jgi:hypothetical protein
MSDDNHNTETRKIAYETWRFQVDSYWTRNSYFAAFEIAAAAGVWTVGNQKHHWMALGFTLICLALTAIWFIANERVHEYIAFWWQMAIDSDRCTSAKESTEAQPKDIGLASRFEAWRTQKGECHCFGYSRLIQAIPILFFVGWVFLIRYNFLKGIHYMYGNFRCLR